MFFETLSVCILFLRTTMATFDHAQTSRPRWVYVRPGEKPMYEPFGKTVVFQSRVEHDAKALSTLTTDSHILAIAPEGICEYDVYKNPANRPAEKMFTVEQEYAGSGRGVVSLTPWGAEAIGEAVVGTNFKLEIMASACGSGLKIGALVNVTVVGEKHLSQVERLSDDQNHHGNRQEHNEVFNQNIGEKKPKKHRKSNKHLHESVHLHEPRFDDQDMKNDVTFSELKPSKQHHRQHKRRNNALKSIPVVDELAIDEAPRRPTSTASKSLDVALGANACAFATVLVVLGIVLAWRRKIDKELDEKFGRRAVGKAEVERDARDFPRSDTGGVRITLNPFEDSFVNDDEGLDGEMEEIDLEETQELKEYNFEEALHLTMHHEFDDSDEEVDVGKLNADGYQGLEWDDQL